MSLILKRRKFQSGERVKVNRRAKGRSWFTFKKGRVVGYKYPCYEIDFTLPGNGHIETRHIQAWHLNAVR